MAFDKEGFQEYLNTEEGQSWFKGIAKTLGFLSQDEVDEAKSGVAAKNSELLGKLKAAKEENVKLTERVESSKKIVELLDDFGIGVDDPDEPDYDSIEQALKKLKSGQGDADPEKIEELNRQLKRAQRDLEQTKKEVTARDGRIEELSGSLSERESVISSLLIDSAFENELLKHGYGELIVPTILPALRAKSNAQIRKNEETGEYEAIVDDGRGISDWVNMWKDTDEGKALRPGKTNSGGGGRGSGNGAGGQTKPFKELTPTERVQLMRTNPDLYKRLKAEA